MAVATRPSTALLSDAVQHTSAAEATPSFDHSAFLKRNGSVLRALLSTDGEIPSRPLPFHQALLVFVAAEKPAQLVDGRVLRGLRRAFTARNLTHVDESYWRKRLAPSLGPRAPARVARLVEILRQRGDYPGLDSMARWGLPKWEELLSRIGLDEREARTIISLVLGREEYLPSGYRYEPVYRRLGVKVDQDGVPKRLSFSPEDMKELRWQIAAHAYRRCTPELDPGGPVCQSCPILRFCQKGRSKVFERSDGPAFIDVFAGGGGMSLGFSMAGFREKATVELDVHAADTLYFNHPELGRRGILTTDVEDVASDPWFVEENRGIPVLIGGPPCQPFSMAHRHNHPDEKDERRFLFRPFLQLARLLAPRLVIMENVPGIHTAANGETIRHVTDEFHRAGFDVDHRVLDAADYGVPQRRRRVFFIGINRDFHRNPVATFACFWEALERQRTKAPVTVADALSGIPRLRAGEGGLVVKKRPGKRSAHSRSAANGTIFAFNHETRPHNPRDIRIFRLLKRGEPAWKLEERIPGTIPYQTDSFPDKFRKLRLNEPSPTIPAHLSRDANSFVHPHVPRGITCREAARLQSFPDDYIFLGGFGPAFTQTGNAVPPLLARAVARAALSVLPPAKGA